MSAPSRARRLMHSEELVASVNATGPSVDSSSAVRVGLPLGLTPVPKLESGVHRPVFELAGAHRRTGRTLAARSFPALADDSRARSAAGQHCNGAAIARSAPVLRGVS